MSENYLNTSVILRLFKRQECVYKEINYFIKNDTRAKQLLSTVQQLDEQKHEIAQLLDPHIKNPNVKLTQRNIADINKQWLFRNRNKLTEDLSNLLIYLQSVFSSLFNASPAIEDVTHLTENLTKIYNATLTNVEKINSLISKIEATIFPDEIMTYLGELRKTWLDIDLLLINQIISPLKKSLQEYAREESLKVISQKMSWENIPVS
ncbi:MAG: hypothetical protein QM398_06230 [Thermoproteota archaeon]|jgi:uncharacterized protein YoxC|nr:hypothetical protein [Thermoproteota archaeon]